MVFDSFWFYSADKIFSNKDYTLDGIKEILLDNDEEILRRYIPGPLSFSIQTLLLGLVLGQEYNAVEGALLSDTPALLSNELARIHKSKQILAAPNKEFATDVLDSLITMVRVAGGTDFPDTYDGRTKDVFDRFGITSQIALITVVNQTSYTLQMSGSSAYKGDVLCTFPRLDPVVHCFGEPLYSVGVFASGSTITTGAASAIELAPATTTGNSPAFRVVIASASPIIGTNTLLVAVNSSDPAKLANENDSKGGAHFQKSIDGTNVHIEASVQSQAGAICHVRVILRETN